MRDHHRRPGLVSLFTPVCLMPVGIGPCFLKGFQPCCATPCCETTLLISDSNSLLLQGKVKRKRVPLPGSLCTSTSPPCSFTTWLTITSPKPVPGPVAFVVYSG